MADMREVRLTLLFKGKSASVAHSRSSSLVLDENVSKLLDVNLPWSSRAGKEKAKTDKEKKVAASDKENATVVKKDAQAASSRSGHGHSRSQSQPKLQLQADGAHYNHCSLAEY